MLNVATWPSRGQNRLQFKAGGRKSCSSTTTTIQLNLHSYSRRRSSLSLKKRIIVPLQSRATIVIDIGSSGTQVPKYGQGICSYFYSEIRPGTAFKNLRGRWGELESWRWVWGHSKAILSISSNSRPKAQELERWNGGWSGADAMSLPRVAHIKPWIDLGRLTSFPSCTFSTRFFSRTGS